MKRQKNRNKKLRMLPDDGIYCKFCGWKLISGLVF